MDITLLTPAESRDARRVFIRCLLLLCPFVILQALELFVLPIDLFTFRVWEAAVADPYRYPGGFYPNLHVKKEKEYGYYQRGDASADQGKPAEWFTDSYGWRNRPEIEKQDRYDIVVVGDSNVAGSFLDQKDTLAEVLGAKSGKVCYSYAIGVDPVSLFFSDPRMAKKSPGLLVVQTRAGNWSSNHLNLSNFRETPEGLLEVVDRSQEFTTDYYSSNRNHFMEKLASRLPKQSMFYWLKAKLSVDFTVPDRRKNKFLLAPTRPADSAKEAGWRPTGWKVENGDFMPMPGEPQPALKIKAAGPYSLWRTERFVSIHPDGRIIARFEARNSVTASRVRVVMFEDGVYSSVREFIVAKGWQAFEIPFTVNPNSALEFQIEQEDDWQWLSLRDFRAIGGGMETTAGNTDEGESDNDSLVKTDGAVTAFPKPLNLTPLDRSGRALTPAESSYYFYHAAKAMRRKANERGMDFIFFVLPENNISRLIPAISQLRAEGVKVLAYEPQGKWKSGVDLSWYMHKGDPHWTEAAIRLTADEILRMWETQAVANRPFSEGLKAVYSKPDGER